ncbi:hypothetical protein BDW75DRAFT_221821 [Aspergillus navahoensis]
MLDALHQLVGKCWKSLCSIISHYLGTIRYNIPPTDIESPPITLDDEVLRSIDEFEKCEGAGQSATLGPFLHLFVRYIHGERGVVHCPHSFFKKSTIVQERLKPLLTEDQWNHMNAPFSNYRFNEKNIRETMVN